MHVYMAWVARSRTLVLEAGHDTIGMVLGLRLVLRLQRLRLLRWLVNWSRRLMTLRRDTARHSRVRGSE